MSNKPFEWVSVNDRLPDIDGPDVLVIDESGSMTVGFTFGVMALGDDPKNEKAILTCESKLADPHKLTHWAPLPAPPEKESGK